MRLEMEYKDMGERYIWQCEKCGRIGYYKFYEHASTRGKYDCCGGKVRRIKFKNSW